MYNKPFDNKRRQEGVMELLSGKVEHVCDVRNFRGRYLLIQTQYGPVLRRYKSNGSYELIKEFPENWSLLNEIQWKSCIQESRRLIGKNETIYWCDEEAEE